MIGLCFFALKSADVRGAGTRDEPLRMSAWEARQKRLLKAEVLPLSTLVNICQPFAALVSLSLSVLVKFYQPLVILFSTGPDNL